MCIRVPRWYTTVRRSVFHICSVGSWKRGKRGQDVFTAFVLPFGNRGVCRHQGTASQEQDMASAWRILCALCFVSTLSLLAYGTGLA